jgi:hypothetical protein
MCDTFRLKLLKSGYIINKTECGLAGWSVANRCKYSFSVCFYINGIAIAELLIST